LAARLEDEDNSMLRGYLDRFLGTLSGPGSAPSDPLVTLKSILVQAIIIWVSGLIVFGVPVTLFLLTIRGAALGFSVAFFVRDLGVKGIMFALAGIAPQNLVAIPALVGLCASSLAFSLAPFQRPKVGIRRERKTFGQRALNYTLECVVFCLLMLVAGFIEVYVSPVFMRLVLPALP
jgi:stage II sporulation protein M